MTSGGAIPDVADYRVVLEPEETLVGTVNEDWAIESMAGDVFLLGSATWRIRRVEPGTVRVVDAEGASPSLPFWLGEAPARTAELSEAVSQLRRKLETCFGAAGSSSVEAELPESAKTPAVETRGAIELVETLAGIDRAVAQQVVAYLGAGVQRARSLADDGAFRDRTVLRRHGRHAARGSLAPWCQDQPCPRTCSAEAFLQDLRLRAAGGRER